MQEEITTQQKENYFWTSEKTDRIFAALLKYHSEPISITKDGTVAVAGRKDRKYVTLDSILNAVKPALANADLFLTQHLNGDFLTTFVIHKDGQFIASKFPFQTMSGNGTNALQNLGGGLTYLRRYALTAILGIAADEDTDGEGSTIEKKSTEAKAAAPAPSRIVGEGMTAPAKKTPEAKIIERVQIDSVEGAFDLACEYVKAKGTKIETIEKKYFISEEQRGTLIDIQQAEIEKRNLKN
jgi:hypothetical protein